MKTIIVLILMFSCNIAWAKDDHINYKEMLVQLRNGCYICDSPNRNSVCMKGKKHFLEGSEIENLQVQIKELKNKLDWLMNTICWQADGKKTPMSEIIKYNEANRKMTPNKEKSKK